MKRDFVYLGASGCAIIFWIAKSIFGGAIYATAAFFAKRFWESKSTAPKNMD